MDDLRLELYWNDIPTEKALAVSYSQLQAIWKTSERNTRLLLARLSSFDNGDNYILIRSGQNKGFFKTDNEEIIAAYRKEILNKGRSMMKPIKKINRVLSAHSDQMSIENNLRLYRETLKLKQKDVCKNMQEYDPAFNEALLSKMENNICLPTFFQLQRLAELYECEASDLVAYL